MCVLLIATLSQQLFYRGSNPVEHFLNCLLEEEEEIGKILNGVIPMNITKEQEVKFKHADNCHICGNELGRDRVRDHDHLTGEFRYYLT